MDVHTVAQFYSQLNKHNLETLQEIYHPNIVFEDAAHRIEGFVSLA
ncbi:nuclear transport factor 2 family protein, partial [Vibrio parahaemolyticus]|nr:nuclear transport factor 2 family protein [Vibrio parahaemolyticus]